MTQQQSQILDLVEALSACELEVLNLVADGLTNDAIAEQLHVSPNTVKYHLKNVLQKLQLHNRAQAAAYAAQHGWLNHQISSG